MIELAAYDVSVNVIFLGGADFDSPPPLGDTGRSRYAKVRTLAGGAGCGDRPCGSSRQRDSRVMALMEIALDVSVP